MKVERKRSSGWTIGVSAALMSACFLGLAPVFGKQAINFGIPALAVVAVRTSLATALVFVVVAIKNRQLLYIYPAGMLGCFLAGGINGIGSLFYYGSLARIPAGMGQLLYSLYPLFVLIWMWLDRQPPSRLTLLRLVLVLPGIILITYRINGNNGRVDFIGVGMMLVASAMYALHLPINQRVLYDMPAPTVTLYTLLAMSLIVVPAYGIMIVFAHVPNIFLADFWSNLANNRAGLAMGIIPLIGLTVVTFLSRLTLFLGVKHLGGLQAALLGLGELLVTLLFSQLLLKESLSWLQWVGAILVAIALCLVAMEKSPQQKRFAGGWLAWLRPPGIPNDFPWPHE